jgi:hypothetical protein
MTMDQALTALVEDADIHGPGRQVEATIRRVRLGVKSPEILCRERRHARAAGVKLLHESATHLAEPRKQESNHDHTSEAPHGSGNHTAADPVFSL